MNLQLNEYIQKFSTSEIGLTDEFEFIKDLNACIQQYIDKFKKPNETNWGKLQGYISLRLLQRYIDSKIELTQYQTSELNSFISGYSTEFDLLIVKKNNEKKTDTVNLFPNIYNPEDVKTIIEVKTSGIIASKDNIGKIFERMKEDVRNIRENHSHIKYIYFTIFERGKPIRTNSFNYINETIKGLDPHKAFFIFDVVEWQIREKELIKFITEII